MTLDSKLILKTTNSYISPNYDLQKGTEKQNLEVVITGIEDKLPLTQFLSLRHLRNNLTIR